MERASVTRNNEEPRHDKTQETQTTRLGEAAGLNQSARADQPSKLCDHQQQPTALSTSAQEPPNNHPQLNNITGTDIYEEVYRNFCHRQKYNLCFGL